MVRKEIHCHMIGNNLVRAAMLASALKFGCCPSRLSFTGAMQAMEEFASSMRLHSGRRYTELRPVIGICILDLVLYPRVSDIHLDFRLQNNKHGLTFTDHLQIHLFELPKYTPPSDNVEITDPIDQWCYFLLQADELTAGEIAQRLPDPAFSGEPTESLEGLTSLGSEKLAAMEANLQRRLRERN